LPEDLHIGILWRGDRSARPSAPDPGHGLAPLYEAFEQHPLTLRPVVFEDTAFDDVREAVRQHCFGWPHPELD
jgi:hypothetical protein